MPAMTRPSLAALALLLCACGSPPSAQDVPATLTMNVAPGPAPSVDASAEVIAAPPSKEAITFYPVIRIFSLMDLWQLEDGSLEVRIGYDPGGGMRGLFRFAPLVGGVPDLEQETEAMTHADTTFQGRIELIGTRPNLIYHSVAGFRSGPMDQYEVLADDNTWTKLEEPNARTPGVGQGVYAWTDNRLLEVRMEMRIDGPLIDGTSPSFRVFRGKNTAVPSLPKPLTKRLIDEGFSLASTYVLPTGEVIMVGRLPAGGTGTLLWRKDLKNPEYFVASDVTVGKEDTDVLSFLGGSTLADLRLRANQKLLKLDGSRWVVTEELADGAIPDVWFGRPRFHYQDRDVYVRLAADQPYKLVHKYEEGQEDWPSFAIDKEGVLWKVQGGLLSATKAPAQKYPDVSDEALVAARKKSITRGGSWDAPTDLSLGSSTCSKCYLVLHKAKADKMDGASYAEFRRALDGSPKLKHTELIVTKEKGYQFLGVASADWDTLYEVRTYLQKKKIKGMSPGFTLCADPPVTRRL